VWKFVKNDGLPEEGRRWSDWAATYLSVAIDGKSGEVREEREMIARFRITIDPSRKPKAIDLTIDYFFPEADPRNKDVVKSIPPELRVTGRTIRAIYSLDGEVFKVYSIAHGKERPKAFPDDAAAGVLTLRRQARGK
jgi:uncharacterized protein (TIGR03067 family)